MPINTRTRLIANGEFTAVEELDIADQLLTSHDTEHDIHYLNRTETNKDNYALSFADGSRLYAHKDTRLLLSNWKEQTQEEPQSRPVSLQEAWETPQEQWAYSLTTRFSPSIPLPQNTLDPYLFGLWASGTLRENDLTAHLNPGTIARITRQGYSLYKIAGEVDITGLMLDNRLYDMGINERIIPACYLSAPLEVRYELTLGLIAHINKPSDMVSLTSSSIALISTMRLLLSTLGLISTIRKVRSDYKDYYTITFPHLESMTMPWSTWNHIAHIEPLPQAIPEIAITLENPNRAFLVGDALIPVLSE